MYHCNLYQLPIYLLQCLCGGTGRRDRLKICCPLGCAGSIPARGTILEDHNE